MVALLRGGLGPLPPTLAQAQGIERRFAQTSHSLAGCFLGCWDDHGGAYVFGRPLTKAQVKANTGGDTVLTQCFDRARYEWRPTSPAGPIVLHDLLGNELWAELPSPPPSAITLPPARPAADTPSTPPLGRDRPAGHPIKGSITNKGGTISHVPGSQFGAETFPEHCLCTEADAQTSGFRRSQ